MAYRFIALLSVLLVSFAGRLTIASLNLRADLNLGEDREVADSDALSEEAKKLIGISEYLRLRQPQMSRESIKHYIQDIEDDTGSWDVKAFCENGHLLCEANATRPKNTKFPYTFFDKSDIVVSRKIPFPLVEDEEDDSENMPLQAFLPESLAQKFPLDSHFVTVMLDMLDIPVESNLAKHTRETVDKCEKQHAKKKAVYLASLKDMATFVFQNLGPEVQTVDPSHLLAPSPDESTVIVKKISVIGSPKSQKAIVCTVPVFLFSVFLCKLEERVEIIQVTTESKDEQLYSLVMHCGEKKRHHHRLLLLPKETGGEGGKVCHWSRGEDLVFVKKDEAEEKKCRDEKEKEIELTQSVPLKD